MRIPLQDSQSNGSSQGRAGDVIFFFVDYLSRLNCKSRSHLSSRACLVDISVRSALNLSIMSKSSNPKLPFGTSIWTHGSSADMVEDDVGDLGVLTQVVRVQVDR